MDQTRKARLEAGGIMVDEALERFMGNEAMLEPDRDCSVRAVVYLQ